MINSGNERSFTVFDDEVVPEGLSTGRELTELLEADSSFELLDEPLEKKQDEAEEADDFQDLDFGADISDKTTDPVRMYLREMGTVPLLNREGEIELAKRIERGQTAVMKSLSRSPLVIRELIALAEEIAAGRQSVRDLLLLPDPPITDEFVDEEAQRLVGTIGEIEKMYRKVQQFQQKLLSISRTLKPKQHRQLRWDLSRTLIKISQTIRGVGFTTHMRHMLRRDCSERAVSRA